MPNVEKVAPIIEVELGGKTRRLVCDLWALAMMENASGESAMHGKFFTALSMNKLITTVWGCLLEDEDVAKETEKKGIVGGRKLVAKWIDLKEFDTLTEACRKAFESVAATSSDEDASEGNEPKEVQSGIG
jgi:hypothetical protein